MIISLEVPCFFVDHKHSPIAEHRAGVAGVPYMATALSVRAVTRPTASPGPSLWLVVTRGARVFRESANTRFTLMQEHGLSRG